MIHDNAALAEALDTDLIGFITTVNAVGQPQTSPVWFVRDGDDLIIFNRSDAAKLASIEVNPKVAFNLRGDLRAHTAVTLECEAAVDPSLPPSTEIPEYQAKYEREIERLGWTDTFHKDYPTGIRLKVTRVRSWGLTRT